MEIQLYKNGVTPGISGEWLLCEKLNEGRARVISVPFLDDWLSSGDIVLYDGDLQITWVQEKVARTFHIEIEEIETEEADAIVDYFKRNGVICEQLTSGYFGFGVPNAISDSKFADIVANAPLKMEFNCEG